MADEGAQPDYLVVGHVTKAHGTKGEVFVMPLTDRLDDVFDAGRVLEVEAGDEDQEAFEPLVIESVRPFKSGVLVKFEGLDGREAVDALVRRYLRLPIEEVSPLEEGEVFYHQLIGLEVSTVSGDRVGRVREIYETGAAHLLEVSTDDGRQLLIPFTEQIVRKLDVAGGMLTIEPPPGLLDV